MNGQQDGISTLEKLGKDCPDLEVEIEELEPIVAPGIRLNSNETLLADIEEE